MSSRDRTMVIVLLSLILFGGGGLLGYLFVYEPLQAKRAEAETLQASIDKLDGEVNAILKAAPRLAEAKRASLPPDLTQAKSEYNTYLVNSLRDAKFQEVTFPKTGAVNTNTRGIPEYLPKKPAYTPIQYTIEIQHANIWQLADFLIAFYQTPLLQQITELTIKHVNKVTDTRAGLTVTIGIEALVLDGAEARSGLFAATEDAVQDPAPPTLARKPEAYSYVALHDIFYGLLPPVSKKPFEILDLTKVEFPRDGKSIKRKVWLDGMGAEGSHVTVSATGSLIPTDKLKVENVDSKTWDIIIPSPPEDAPDSATSTITVEATSSDGVKVTKSLMASVTKSKKFDISGVIKLVGLTGTDESRTSLIFDQSGPFRYEVTVDAKSARVMKWKPRSEKSKDYIEDPTYRHAPGLLVISDDYSATNRTLKVIAADGDALIVADVGLADGKPKIEPMGGKAGRPGFGGRPGGAPKQGPASPLAVVASNLAIAVPPPAPPVPAAAQPQVLYRWAIGKSLKELDANKLTPEETKTILKRVADGVVSANAGN